MRPAASLQSLNALLPSLTPYLRRFQVLSALSRQIVGSVGVLGVGWVTQAAWQPDEPDEP